MRSSLACLVMMMSACAGGYRTAGPVEHVGPPGAELATDSLQRHLDHALHARAALRARLVALGAIPRPPRPDPIAEEVGDPPFAGARWMLGRWEWEHGAWGWHAGYWTDVAHDEIYERELLGGDDIYAGDLFSPLDSKPERVRDHRDRDRDREWFGPRLRDHRSDKPTPTVRDHRDSRDDTSSASIRDHRDDKQDDKSDDNRHQDDDGFGPVRDHRR